MLASIHPLGERARRRRWGRTASAYILASSVGGAALGAGLGLAGAGAFSLLGSSSTVAVATVSVAAVAAAALDLRVGGLRLPTVKRQVNEDWLSRYRGPVVGAGFGLQLGLGCITIVTTAMVYLTFVTAFWAASIWSGLLIGLTFGLVRGATILAVANVHRPEQLRRVHRRLAALERPSWWASVGAEVLVAVMGLTWLAAR
jgi:hypothetical protein